MAKSSQIFAFSRLKLTIKKEWGENRRQFLLLILFITGAMSIESFLQISSAYNQVEYLYMTTGGENVDFHTAAQQHLFYERYHYMQHVLFAIILVSFTALAASLAFSSTSTKEGTVRDLTCPASQTEKFAARFGLYIVGGWVTAVSAWIFVAFGSYIIMSMLTPYGDFFHPTSVGPLFDADAPRSATLAASTILTSLFLQSLFFLGSSFWPRNSFIKTFGAGTALFGSMVLIAVLTTYFCMQFLQPGPDKKLPHFLGCPETYYMLTLFMSAVNYTLAFIRYRETDVVRIR